MSVQSPHLGGRLPLLDPASMQGKQRELYDEINQTMVAWAEAVGFRSKTADGRLIGPFNTTEFSPDIGGAFLTLQALEKKHTSLDERVRQIVILTVGSIWESPYELYAHAASAGKTGLSEDAVRALRAGDPATELTPMQRAAQRFTWQLTAEHRVDDQTYQLASNFFDAKSLVDMVMLAGCYHIVCALLNAFAVPAPGSEREFL